MAEQSISGAHAHVQAPTRSKSTPTDSNAGRLAVGIGTFARAFRDVVDGQGGQAHE